MGSARTGSNPVVVDFFIFCKTLYISSASIPVLSAIEASACTGIGT